MGDGRDDGGIGFFTLIYGRDDIGADANMPHKGLDVLCFNQRISPSWTEIERKSFAIVKYICRGELIADRGSRLKYSR